MELLEFLKSELSLNRAMGDIQTMLADLWNKRENPSLVQDSKKRPKSYRGIKMGPKP